ncbi:MAG: hypothetical protein ACYSVY_22850 [Planctomycetota bacterium]
MYAARAVAEAVIQDRPNADISVNIVWIPMVAGDSKAAAQKMSSLFPDARVQQFWDASRRCGIAYARYVFPRWAKDAVAALPENDPSRTTLKARGDGPPEQRPLWDIVLCYQQGVEWTNHPPTPRHWVCQHEFYGKRQDGKSGLFWRDDFATKLIASDWFAEVRQCLGQLAKANPIDDRSHAPQ